MQEKKTNSSGIFRSRSATSTFMISRSFISCC